MRRTLWLITTSNENGRMGVLTGHYGDGEEALLIFSFEEEAEAYLRLEAPGVGWRVRETTVRELVSVIYRLCEGVKRVALDPLPITVGGTALISLVSLDRERFLRSLLSNHWLGEPVAETVPDEVVQEEVAGCDQGVAPERTRNL